MKRKCMIFSLIACILLLCSFQVKPPISPIVAEAETDPAQILSARFLNMLNHNQAYGNDFYDANVLTARSVVSLRNRDGAADSEFIPEQDLHDYLFSMYGVEKSDFSDYGNGWPQKEGFVYVIPQGFTVYEHELVSAVRNEDGSFTVTTDVTVLPHDGEAERCDGVALFLENPDSPFGYQLISAELYEKNAA